MHATKDCVPFSTFFGKTDATEPTELISNKLSIFLGWIVRIELTLSAPQADALTVKLYPPYNWRRV